MFNITRRDLAWGTGIACAAAMVIFFGITSNLVNSTAKVTVDGTKSVGVIAKGFIPATMSDPEEAGDLADFEEATFKTRFAAVEQK